MKNASFMDFFPRYEKNDDSNLKFVPPFLYVNQHKLAFEGVKIFHTILIGIIIILFFFFQILFHNVNVFIFSYFETISPKQFLRESEFSNFGHVAIFAKRLILFGRHFETVLFFFFFFFC